MAKKKIREQFDTVYQNGDEQAIKKMLNKNPWLRDEIKTSMDANMTKQNQVLVALGVMEDELGGAVPLDEIVFSLRVDFNIRKDEAEVHQILGGIEDLNLVKRETNGWGLTKEGGKICEIITNYNNKFRK